MQLVQASDAARLSGLTAHQLREWCGRRGVVMPDVPPGGRGRHALYSWQTLLALRVLNELHSKFRVEVGAWAPAMAQCQSIIRGYSFVSLWGEAIAFRDTTDVELACELTLCTHSAFLCIPLDPHLEALASALALPIPGQLPLFAAVAVQR